MDNYFIKKPGHLTKKEVKIKNKENKLDEVKQTQLYKKVKEAFKDAELIDIKNNKLND